MFTQSVQICILPILPAEHLESDCDSCSNHVPSMHVCVFMVIVHSFLILSVIVSAICGDNCDQCINASVCTHCKASFYLDLNTGACLKPLECPAGTFPNANLPNPACTSEYRIVCCMPTFLSGTITLIIR